MIVACHRGLLEVYCEALSAMALLGFQLPRASMLPTILMVWPYCVLTSSSKVTATAVAVVQPLLVVVVVVVGGVVVGGGVVVVVVVVGGGTPVFGVWDGGKEVAVALE